MTAVGTRETPRERLAYHGYALAERLARALPERWSRAVFAALGRLAHAALPGVRATVARNLARVLGRPPDDPLVRAATREAFDLYARYWHDTFRLPAMGPEVVRARFRVEGLEHLDAALARGRGAICVAPHMGNWDAAGAWLAASGYRAVAVAERLRPERLYRLFVRHRERLGIGIIPLEPGGGVARRLAEHLAENRIVGLIADRDLTGRGIEVEMFGARRRLPSGPATLALTTGAPLLPCAVYTEPEGWRCVIGAPVELPRTGDQRADAEAITRAVAAAFERAIAASPADWHMFQPAWEG
ncbi:MAG TPA: phosphatidylinositol mannoside acyltransferase [Actinomycetota bacterium]|nr:phosphatidylinositol mannoside acyltransferase [Actinomycetota bacterium]